MRNNDIIVHINTHPSGHGVQVERRCGVTAGRGQGQRRWSDVRVHSETGVGERHEQQGPAQAAHQPRQHAAPHRTGLAGHLEHVAHQPRAELSQQADGGQHQRAARAQCVVDGQRELDQARDRVDGAPGRVAPEQQSSR